MRKLFNSFIGRFLRSMLASNPRTDKPILVIFGATGAGKSKLAIDLAVRLNGEIISADSMQVYKGLDIITNKVTDEEQRLCKHHLIGFLDPLDEYNIQHFQKDAKRIIHDIHARNKLPILVGGTNYYIQSVLWNHLVDDKINNTTEIDDKLRQELSGLSPNELHAKLHAVDPDYAKTLHPNCTRKVIRSLEIFHRTNKRHSDFIREQQITTESRGSSLLYSNICGIHVTCKPDILKTRIENRVDKMLNAGLLKELEDFHEEYNRQKIAQGLPKEHYEHGIFQSIGFKEFHDYLTSPHRKEAVKLMSIYQMKLATWQYAKYQLKWIRKRVVNHRDSFPVYNVDASDPSLWKEKDLLPSLKMLSDKINWNGQVDGVNKETFKGLEGVIYPEQTLPNVVEEPQTVYRHQVCELCNGRPLFIDEQTWQNHLGSRRHKKAIQHFRREKQNANRELCQILDAMVKKVEHG